MASVHHDLLEQAIHLAALDRKKPKQVNLRRAVSAAYYAVFHFLITKAVDNVASSKIPIIKNQLRRGFSHKEMKNVCKEYAIATSSPPAQISKNISYLCKTEIQIQIKRISKIFCELQEARHAADYDLGQKFSRTQVIALITRAKDTIDNDWPALLGLPAAHANVDIFLTNLAFRGRWDRKI